MPQPQSFNEFEALPQWERAQLLAISTEENVAPWSLNMDNFAAAQMCANLAFEEASGHEERYDCYERSL